MFDKNGRDAIQSPTLIQDAQQALGVRDPADQQATAGITEYAPIETKKEKKKNVTIKGTETYL